MFIIEGTPRPQGSKRHVGNGVMIESSKYVKEWRAFAKLKAIESKPDRIEKPNAVGVSVTFYFERPKKHFRANGKLRDDAPLFHIVKPDGEKLMRALLDAITGVCFHDDSQVARQHVEKKYGTPARAVVAVYELKD